MLNSMPNRVSYTFNLTGPSCFVDTACSSSITALHLAVSAIERGDCSGAIVGSAQVNRDPFEWVSYTQAGLLPPDGMCKPFDNGADGFGRGEGAVVLVLKPLKDAVRDNDHVYSVIVGSAINATGSRMPLNVPSGIAQQGCIYEAYSRACLDPKDADYIELHATGTAVGDPIEVNTAGPIFGKGCLVGSVKGNIGHLEGTAFLASLVKACLVFEQGTIPPTVISTLTRAIDWDDLQVTVPVQPTALGCRSSQGRSTISLSASGLGGSTGHVVVHAPPALNTAVAQPSSSPVLFLVGGLSSNVVEQISRAASLLDTTCLSQHAVTLSRRARQMAWRTYFTIPLSPSASIPSATRVPNEPPSLAFIFSGQGPQNFEMGRQLFAEYPVFRNTILELDDVYRCVKGVSLLESTGLFDIPESLPTVTLPEFAWPAVVTLAATAMVQIALFDLLKSVGIVPDVLLGHSAGETPVLYASGAGPKEMAMEIAIARGECMASVESPAFGMATVAVGADRASALITQIMAASGDGVLEISCLNAPKSITVSGSSGLLDQLVGLARSQGLFAQQIRTMVPSHSSLLDKTKRDHFTRMNGIFARYPGSHSPRIPVISTCQDQKFVESFSADYFWDNCRGAVQFSKAISHAIESSPVCLEISCHPVLSSSILAHGVADTRVLCPMRRLSTKPSASAAREPAVFLDTVGRLSLLGINSIDLSGLYGFSALKSKLIEHPLTPRVIPPPKTWASHLNSTLSGSNRPLSSSNLRINTTTHPDLAEHVINGEPILPATGFIELLLEAGANFLWDVNFLSILSLASSTPLEVSLQRIDSDWSIRTTTASGEREHAHGCMDKSDAPNLPPALDVSEPWEKLPALNCSDFYPSLEPLVSYGPRFQRVLRCHGTPVEAVAEIKGPSAEELAQNYLLHPVIMDACVHVLLHPGISKEYNSDVVYVASHLERFVFYRREYSGGNWFSSIRLCRWTPECRYYDVLVYDSHRLPLCEMRSLAMKRFSATAPPNIKRRFDLVFQPAGVTLDISPIRDTFAPKSNKSEIVLLYDVLDFLATEMISKSLKGEIACGEDESRRRYLTFARRALLGRSKEPFTPEVVQKLQGTWPRHFEVTNRIAAVHESVFQSPKLVVNSLFSDNLMGQFYAEYGQTSNICGEAAKAFSGLLEVLRTSGKKSIRILEFGAGTGLLTRHLIEELKQNSDLLVEYTVTDISYALVANLADTVSHGSVVPKAYDISQDPNTQDIHPNSYDIIVALHTLHVAPIVEASLGSLQNLLVPGGSLLIVELDGNSWPEKSGSVWFDCVFGSFPEWFGYADGREHCSMAPVAWKRQLEALDFINVQTCTENGGNGRDFFFMAQKHSFGSLSAAQSPLDSQHIYTYQIGGVIELQDALVIHDPTAPITVYILALQGRDADSAVGLCATLRKEFQCWDIRLCIFESATQLSHPIPLLSRHAWAFVGGQNVVSFDQDGSPHVLRLVLSSPPPASVSSAESLRVLEDPDSIEVRVSEWAGMSDRYDGFVGHAISAHQSGISVGDFIGGIAEISSTQVIRVPVGNMVPLTKDPTLVLPADILSAILIPFIDTPSSPPVRILIALENRSLAVRLEQLVSNMPQLELLAADFTSPDAFRPVDILFSDSRTYTAHPHLRRWVRRAGKAVIWDDLLKVAIGRDRSYVARILAKARLPSPDLSTIGTALHRTPSVLPRRCAPPFRADRAYVLLGGISWLGVDLAVWLYQHGARHLVLTSRRGLACLDGDADAMTLAKILYLQSQPDLSLLLEQCDATDKDAMRVLLHNLPIPIAGCFYMPVILRDAPFVDQTFMAAHDSMLRGFENFSTEVPVSALDFFVGISSVVGLFGLKGQSNYASACTALEGALAQHPNAFTLIVPEISENGYGKDNLGNGSAKDIWAWLEDGLRKMDDGPFSRYIPDWNWNQIDARFGLPLAYRHLISRTSQSSIRSIGLRSLQEEILRPVLDLLEISESDFDVLQPLTVYGLDSISSARLSTLLKPHASFSQMQLLGGVAWADIVREIQSAAGTDKAGDAISATNILLNLLDVPPGDFSPDIPLSSYGLESLGAARLASALQPFMAVTQMQLMGETTWADLLQSMDIPDSSSPSPHTEPLVEICSGSGTPLIILPGATGSVLPFFGLRGGSLGPIWAI
ncbi:hypothetical protein DFH06DRAFT_751727 [Mycena polygramma]|nr:hypothetical protein DFH06DRAFT_751727 [Mycena polygramma]